MNGRRLAGPVTLLLAVSGGIAASAPATSRWVPFYTYRDGPDETRLELAPIGQGRFRAGLWVVRGDGCSGTIQNAVAVPLSPARLAIIHPDEAACRVTIHRAASGTVELTESAACAAWHGASCGFADTPLHPGR